MRKTRLAWNRKGNAVNLDDVNEFAPEHDRTSYSDEGGGNEYPNEFGFVRCVHFCIASRQGNGRTACAQRLDRFV